MAVLINSLSSAPRNDVLRSPKFRWCRSIVKYGKMLIIIDDKQAFDEALKNAGDKLVVVDFTATWCGPCQMIGPIFKGLSENPENKNVVFLKVDVDEAQDVASSCGISCMPTFHFYKRGKKIDEFSGANKTTLEEKIKTHK